MHYLQALLDVVVCQPCRVLWVWMVGLCVTWWAGAPEGMHALLGVTLLFYFLDWISGMACAIVATRKCDRLNSRRLRDACIKFVNYAVVVLLGIGIDCLLPVGGYLITMGLISIICTAEAISIVENTRKLGMRYPKGFEDIVERICGQAGSLGEAEEPDEHPAASPSGRRMK